MSIMADPTQQATQQIAVRLPIALIQRIEDYAAGMNGREPGLDATRTDAVRVLLTKALDAESAVGAKRR